MFALIDCNNFFVSCERIFAPKLKNKPVVVLSSNDGCAIARSNEAKALGIPMGARFFEYKSFFTQHNVVTLSSNFALYADISSRVMHTLVSLGFPIEIYSVDEAFLKLQNIDDQRLEELAKSIKTTLLRGLNIPVSVGFGSSKTLAKLANREAKGSDNLFGKCSPGFILDEKLKNTPVDELWGVGRSLCKLLKSHRVYSAYDLVLKPDNWIKKHLKIHGTRLVMELRGTPAYSISAQPSPRKSLLFSRSFKNPISRIDDLERILSSFSAKTSESLRKTSQKAKFLKVFLETSRFDSSPLFLSSYVNLPSHTNSTRVIAKKSLECLKSIFIAEKKFKRLGIMLADMVTSSENQMDLFVKEDPKETELMNVLDDVNTKYGRKSLYFLSEGVSENNFVSKIAKSPAYSTSWKDILKIKL